MEREIRLDGLQCYNCNVVASETCLEFYCKNEHNFALIGEAFDPRDAGFIVADLKNESVFSLVFAIVFWKKGTPEGNAPDLVCAYGLVPGFDTRIVFELKDFDNQTIFPAKTPGRLKSVILGTHIEKGNVGRWGVGVMPTDFEQKLLISRMFYSDSMPEFKDVKVKLADEFGQSKTREWKEKTRSEKEMARRLNSEYGEAVAENGRSLESYKRSDIKLDEGTGFFRSCKAGGRHWLVDPEGYAFLSMGINVVTPSVNTAVKGFEGVYDLMPEKFPGDFGKNNLYRVFGENWYSAWLEITKKRMRLWGINTAGAWADRDFCDRSELPYTVFAGGGNTEKKIYRDFPDVFAPEYRLDCARAAESLKNRKDDRRMLGYFLRNEPKWAFVGGLCLASELLAKEPEYISKKALADYLEKKYSGNIRALAQAWSMQIESFEALYNPIRDVHRKSKAALKDLTEFSAIMVKEYNRVAVEECRKADGNHMCLGIRLGSIEYDKVNLSGSEFFDVLTLNCYDISPKKRLENAAEFYDMPVLIGEFHHGATDVGMFSTGLVGVKTQKDRGDAYRYYVENAIEYPTCVGAHYFQLNDQGLLGRTDGENFQIGFCDVTHKPYEEFIEGVSATNRVIYDIAAGRFAPFSKTPETIMRIGL